VYLTIIQRLRVALAAHVLEKYGEEIAVVLERPPKLELGEAASPVCFELAKRLKKAPRMIAQEIANSLPRVEGIARVEVAGGGYLNAFFDRAAFWSGLLTPAGSVAAAGISGERVIVEHTSINPNKAAHIGHVRNAVLGDTMVRLLRDRGYEVAVQNYIDNTGVQVADVVIAFQQMEKKSLAEVRQLSTEKNFDYLCWDLYAAATQFFGEDKARAGKLRGETLHAIEGGEGETAAMATVIADSVVGFHLRTMARLGIFYELLARESEILHLHFWDAAFEKLKASGAIVFSSAGKTAGCWIMPWNHGGSPDAESTDEDDQAKIIVRSNGTVTYVGKDIAYQLWKFGLLGKDFHYAKWPDPPDWKTVWATTTAASDPGAPHFGNATRVYNVIDARQSYLQKVVAEGLRALGHAKEAENSIHFDYEIVALTPRCAAEMGYELSIEDTKKPYVEVSGRKGFGVKADDLITRMIQEAESRVRQRHPEMSEIELGVTSRQLAVGALRFFLLKVTRNTIIPFDFDEALSAEGETGPYCQYAVVRIRGIRRKGTNADAGSVSAAEQIAMAGLPQLLNEPNAAEGKLLDANADIWALVLHAGSLKYAVEAGIAGLEPAFVSRYAFQLAQAFNAFYHNHHILSESDENKRLFLLKVAGIVETQLTAALWLLGIDTPERM
jgi:arginyl-tRNA synthetase